jgi:hypothetical protein
MYAKSGLSPTAAFAGFALPVMASGNVVALTGGVLRVPDFAASQRRGPRLVNS